jgi:putative ABC transport system permease protein
MRLYDLLLHLYPRSFRHEYGDEMRAVFARSRREATGVGGALALWIGVAAEMVMNAALVHWDVLRQDLAYSVRVLSRAPGFAITAVVIVALGIGATTAAFSVTDFVLIRPLPFPRADRLVRLWEQTPAYRLELSAANYRDWTAENTVFAGTGIYHLSSVNLVGTAEPIRASAAALTADLLPTLGVQPVIGRLFVTGEDREGAPGTVLLSYRLWQTQFGGDAGVIGREVLIDSEKFTVIGVMPREFRFPFSEMQLWTTMRNGEQNDQSRTNNWLYGVARLRDGVTIEQARAEMVLRAARSRQQYPKENANVSAIVSPFGDDVSSQARLLVIALCGAAVCVLLIACANLANLLLARALGRRRELAVRTAIGAGRERMVRQLMTESLMLAALGGALGVAIAHAAVPLLNQLVPATLPTASPPAIDIRVLLFSIALSALTGIAFGLAPVLRVGTDSDLRGLRDGAAATGGRRERVRSVLVITEVVASVVLLVSAGLLMRALWTIQGRDPGFRSEGVLTLSTNLLAPAYGKVVTREVFYTRVLGEVRAIPGVVNAAFVSYLPMGKMRGGIWPVSFNGREVNRADNQNAFLRYVTPGYFATLGIPLKAGRDIDDGDTAGRKPYAAVVSESFIRRYLPGETPASALGRAFSFAVADRVIVGVAGDVRMRGLERDSEPQVYLSYRQVPDNAIIGYVPRGLVVRAAGDPAALTPSIRAIVHRADPALPVSDVNTLNDIVESDTGSRTAQLRVIVAFAVIAFVLAGIGIHGLLSFAVSQRTQEIGVRMALGARSGDIVTMVLGRIGLLAGAGVILGVALAYAAGRSMQALLAGVAPADVPTLGAAVALSVVMTLAGSIVPTLRALHVDPMTAMRTE